MPSENKISYQLKQVMDHLHLSILLFCNCAFKKGICDVGTIHCVFILWVSTVRLWAEVVCVQLHLAESRQAEHLMQISSSISHLVAALCDQVSS